ncbi:hypothetical protein D3C71_314490 [compost metagenome]
MTILLLILAGVYLIGVAFVTAMWLTADDRRYWSAREARLRWFHGAALWPLYVLQGLLWLLWAIPAGFVLQLVERLRERRR